MVLTVLKPMASTFEHAAHFLQGTNRLSEVLESRAAQEEVESIVREGHLGSIALPEVDVHARLGGFLAREFDKGMADVESGDRVRTELGELDGEIARARRDLEHGATGRELAADSQRELCEFVERLASVDRVPLRDHSFHAYVLTSFG